MLRPIAFFHYCEALSAKGVAPSALAAGTDIDVGRLREPDYLINEADHARFIENMVSLTGDQGLGLDLGLEHEVAHFGILAYAGLASESIRCGLENVWSRYGRAFGLFTDLKIAAETKDASTIRILTPAAAEPVRRFRIEEAFCILFRIGQAMNGEAPQIKVLRLDFERPAYGARYADIFGREPQFRSAHSEIIVNRDWINRALRTKDAELNQVCIQGLERQLLTQRAHESLRERVRCFILGQLHDGPSLEQSAQHLDMSSRSLARRLRSEGVTFRDVLDEARCELAQQWLREGDASVKDVSYRVGYRDVAAFRRAFKAWTGTTIGEFRSAAKRPEH